MRYYLVVAYSQPSYSHTIRYCYIDFLKRNRGAYRFFRNQKEVYMNKVK